MPDLPRAWDARFIPQRELSLSLPPVLASGKDQNKSGVSRVSASFTVIVASVKVSCSTSSMSGGFRASSLSFASNASASKSSSLLMLAQARPDYCSAILR